MPFEAIVKLCTDFYSAEEIHAAKDVLWELVISVSFTGRKDLRLIRRKSTPLCSKNRVDMEDIMKALQVCDREGVILPVFYAVDLGRKHTSHITRKCGHVSGSRAAQPNAKRNEGPEECDAVPASGRAEHRSVIAFICSSG